MQWYAHSFVCAIKCTKRRTSGKSRVGDVCVSASTNVKIILYLTSCTSRCWPYYLLHLLKKTSLPSTEVWWHQSSLLDSASCQTTKTAPEQPKETFSGIHVRLWISHCLSHAWLEGCTLHWMMVNLITAHETLWISFYFCEACFKVMLGKVLEWQGSKFLHIDLCTVTDLIIRFI